MLNKHKQRLDHIVDEELLTLFDHMYNLEGDMINDGDLDVAYDLGELRKQLAQVSASFIAKYLT